MPTIEAHILEGYQSSEKSRLALALTDAVRLVVPAPDEAITVLLHEYPANAYMRGGKHRQPAKALPDPCKLVTQFLAAMQARDVDASQAFLGDGFVMTFPGTPPMTKLTELIDWSKTRYRFVEKTNDAVEAVHSNDVAVVYVRGVLSGEWLDGTAFSGIRFIDRFELANGKILRQDVWNDVAEVRPQ